MTEINEYGVYKMKKETNYDSVNNPRHYDLGNGMEVFDVIKEVLGEQGTEGYCIGNVIKYVCRFNKKNGEEDLRKAKWYLDKYLEHSKKN